jgi:uncharacterized protein with beta-barrel porin domain
MSGLRRVGALGISTPVPHAARRLDATWRAWLAFFALAILLLAPALPARAQDAGATLQAQSPSDEPLSARAGQEVPLAVVRRQDGAPLAGATVEWTVEGPDGATLDPDRSVTTNVADRGGAGVARTRFRAREGGHYVVTASSQVNPGCLGEDCAQFVRTAFDIDVAATATADDGSGHHTAKWVGGAVAAAAAIAMLSNDDDNDNDQAQGDGSGQLLAIVSGNGQSAMPNNALPGLLTVRATDDGNLAPNVTINWSASGGAVLSATTTVTTSFGLATVAVVSVGPGPAPITVTATRADNGASVTFTATVLTPELQMVSGNFQSAPTGTTVPAPLVVRALLGGSPQAGVGINWTIVSGDATVAATSGATDAAGLANATIDLGPTPGPVTVQAARADFPTIVQVFTLNSTLTRTLLVFGGNNQTAPPNAPLVLPLRVLALDNGAPAVGVTINWTATNGALPASGTSVTDGSGAATFNITSTGPGPADFQVFAVRADDATANVTFTEHILPPQFTIIAGDGQTGFVNSAATTPLEVKLVDGAGVPVAGQTITWQVIGGSASLAGFSSVTDAAGHATMTFSYGGTPGGISIQAAAYGGTQTVTFSETAQGPGGGTPGGGNGGSGNPGDVIPLTVTITGPAGVTDLSGVTVFWSVISGTGTVNPTTSVTDVAGNATTNLTLGLTPGTVVVQATIQGDGTVLFTNTINGTLVGTQLTATQGNGQVLATGQVSAPMEVQLTDAGTPLAGMTITWTTDNGSMTTFSTVTDASGKATNTVTPSIGGAVNVTASFAAVAQYTASSAAFAHNAALASTPTLSTDEVAVAEALDNACTELQGAGTLTPEQQDLLDQCLALAGAAPVQVADALEEMLPDVAETQAQTGQTAVNAQFDNLKGRLATLRTGQGGNSFGGLTLVGPGGSVSLFGLMQALLADETPAATADAGFSRWGFFASGSIGRGENDQGDNVPSYDYDINGITAGVDYRKSDNLVLGAALGYTRQDTDLSGNQGSVEMRGVSVSGYASWYLQDSWYIDGVLSFGHNTFDNRRRITYSLPGSIVNTVAKADFDGSDRSVTLTFGKDFAHAAWGGGAYGRLLYSRLGFDGFEEEVGAGAGSGLGLRVESRTVTALSTVLGGKLTYTHSADWGVLVPLAQVEWQKEHKSDPELFRAFLIDDPTSTPILVTGEPLDSSFFRVGLGMSLVLTRGRSGFVLYEHMLGRDGMRMDNLSLGFRMEF